MKFTVNVEQVAARLWQEFAAIPVDGNDQLEIDWLFFKEGDSRFLVWKWFESFERVSVAELSAGSIEIDPDLIYGYAEVCPILCGRFAFTRGDGDEPFLYESYNEAMSDPDLPDEYEIYPAIVAGGIIYVSDVQNMDIVDQAPID